MQDWQCDCRFFVSCCPFAQSAGLSNPFRQFPRTPEHRCDLHDVRTPSVHDTTAANYNFPNVVLISLGYHPSRFGKFGEALNGADNPSYGQVGIAGRVVGNVRADPFEVTQ